ncbi:hypothetical protein V1478_018519 [Vespula squamosa]|uniref:Uncharacterized protein n=1 Tax=Vespula squamosa TaxID=30214 RepID=A0ABD1ZSY9_VESSQ
MQATWYRVIDNNNNNNNADDNNNNDDDNNDNNNSNNPTLWKAIFAPVFRVLEPREGCAIVTRSRATDQQSRRSNALLLCIVPSQIKKQGTHEPRDLQRFEREGETTPEFPPPPSQIYSTTTNLQANARSFQMSQNFLGDFKDQ